MTAQDRSASTGLNDTTKRVKTASDADDEKLHGEPFHNVEKARERGVAPDAYTHDIDDAEKTNTEISMEQRESNDKHDPNVVDWEGEEDPENPYNWTKSRKWINGAFVSAMTFVTPLNSSMFAPGVPDVMAEFHSTNQILGSLVVSIYILGYAFGPLFIAPLSELYGRRYVYHVSNILFMIFTLACAVSNSLGSLIGFRFLAGMMGATPLTIGGGTVADMFRQEERGAAMSIWSIGPLIGPVVGPVAGGYLSKSVGWRWCFWIVLIMAGIVTIGMILFHRETYAPRLLELKARRLRRETGNDKLRSKLDSGLPACAYFFRSIVRPTKMLFLSPIVFFLSLYMAVVYGYLYLLFTTMTRVFEDTYNFSPGNVGLAYLGLGVGMFGGLFVTGAISDLIVKALSKKIDGKMKPEFRIPPMIPAAVIIPCGLFIYGWTAQYGVHWIVPIIGTSFVGLGLICTFMPIMTYLVDAYTLHAASAIAANTVLRSILGAMLPLAGPSMYAALGLGWGNSLLGFIALALLPLPFIFWRYGERIRTSKGFQINW